MTTTLDEMETRAQRHLDGMTVNRDAMARDVLVLARAIRSAQKRASEKGAAGNPFSEMGGNGPFAGIFDGIFKQRK